jgi:nucleotide-binding universal stress UspA family protein
MSQPAGPAAASLPDASLPDGSLPGARGGAPEGKAVVVGVDGSDASRAAIALAAREARYRGVLLIAVQAYSGERTLGTPAVRPLSTLRTAEDERIDAEVSLRQAVRDVLGDQADGVEVRAILGLAGRKIVETANKVNAQLIVLATRGSTSMLLGTVSQYVLRKAPCPVLVVPAGPGAARPALA